VPDDEDLATLLRVEDVPRAERLLLPRQGRARSAGSGSASVARAKSSSDRGECATTSLSFTEQALEAL